MVTIMPKGHTNNPNGRPKKTLADLPVGWQEHIVELGRQGKTTFHIYNYLGLNQVTVQRLERDHPELREVMERFRNEAAAYWTDLGQELASGETQGSAIVWKFNMANRVGWSDKVSQETETTLKADESAADLFHQLLTANKKDDSDEETEE